MKTYLRLTGPVTPYAAATQPRGDTITADDHDRPGTAGATGGSLPLVDVSAALTLSALAGADFTANEHRPPTH